MKREIYFLAALLLCTGTYACKKSNNGTSKEEQEVIVEVKSLQQRSAKRGVSYNFQIMDDVNLLGEGVSWFYNWANDISSDLDQKTSAKNIAFYPMTWNGNFNKDRIRAYKAKHPECEYILAYNEPNLTDQANMTPQQAAAIFHEVKSLADELKMKIVSPAMNYGTLAGYSDPVKWLDEFFTLVPVSYFDAIALHCYMAVPSAFKSYVERFKKYGKPIWMTEFCAWEPSIGNVNQQIRYMCDVVNYMEANPQVVKYAWFIPRNAGSVDTYPFMQLLTKTQPYTLTSAGKVFINMSSFDKTLYYGKGVVIPAAHYTALNSTTSATQDGQWAQSIYLRPTTDKSGVIEVYDFLKDRWMEYQIDVPADGAYKLKLRHASYSDVSISIGIDGQQNKTWTLAKTGEDNIWKTSETDITLTKGKHTLRLTSQNGTSCLNWLSFN